MKGVVLSGGAGTRLRPITFAMAKQLVPVANKPIIYYGLEDLAEAGIEEVAIVISPETGGEVEATVGDGSRFGLNLHYVTQPEPLGLAHALQVTLPVVGDDDILMYLGDNLVKRGVVDVVRDFEEHRPNAQILLHRVENPSDFGVAELDAAGRVLRLGEKPKVPPSDLALVGGYLFDQSIGDALAAIEPSSRGELEITDAIQWLLDHDREVRASTVSGWWKDTGKKEDLLHANELVMEDLTEKLDGDLIDCRVRGPVQVGAGSRLVECDLIGPLVIGEDVAVTRSLLGPNTTIGDGSSVHDAFIENSLLMDHVQIQNWRLRNSLLGHRAAVVGAAPPTYVELTLGERSEIVG